jgi:hypothetical protein
MTIAERFQFCSHLLSFDISRNLVHQNILVFFFLMKRKMCYKYFSVKLVDRASNLRKGGVRVRILEFSSTPDLENKATN